jgi:hypothetical protein
MGLYRLVSAKAVTHAAVLEPHRQQVLRRMRERPGGRKGDGPPEWLTLWRGWNDLQLMIQGALAVRGGA